MCFVQWIRWCWTRDVLEGLERAGWRAEVAGRRVDQHHHVTPFRAMGRTLTEPSTSLKRLRHLHVTSEEKKGIVDRHDQSMYTVSHAPS